LLDVWKALMDKALARRGRWRALIFSEDIKGRFLLPGKTGRWYEGRLRWEGGTVAVFVKNPPRSGTFEHESCLQYIDKGWFRLHFNSPPRSLEAAVVFTEEFLLQCSRGY
jgi:hypothetical protein